MTFMQDYRTGALDPGRTQQLLVYATREWFRHHFDFQTENVIIRRAQFPDGQSPGDNLREHLGMTGPEFVHWWATGQLLDQDTP